MLATSDKKRLQYRAMPLAGLLPDALPPVNLYLPGEGPGQVRLYRSGDVPVRKQDIDSLRARGVKELLVDPVDYTRIKEFLAANLDKLLEDESQPATERLLLLNQVVSETLRETLFSTNVTESIHKSRALAEHMVDVCIRSDVSVRDVAQLARHDFCTFSHSANVSCFCVLLAHSVGIIEKAELQEIAVGGMVHDIGKLHIPNQILTKPGRLTDEEFAIVRLHPTRGFQILRKEPSITTGQLLMTYQHHEWMNGKGYPVGCLGDELHLWSRICAVVDVFEALTAKRPYRRPNTIAEAFEIMDRDGTAHFDGGILKCWKSHFVNHNRE